MNEEMKALAKKVGEVIMSRPIAAVLPAEPGWRVVMHRRGCEGAEKVEDLYLLPVHFWAVEPTLFSPRSWVSYPSTDMPPKVAQPSFHLYPLDENKARYDAENVYALAGPDESDAAITQRLVELTTKRRDAGTPKTTLSDLLAAFGAGRVNTGVRK